MTSHNTAWEWTYQCLTNAVKICSQYKQMLVWNSEMKVDGWYLLFQENLSLCASFPLAFQLCFPQSYNLHIQSWIITRSALWFSDPQSEKRCTALRASACVWICVELHVSEMDKEGEGVVLKNPYKEEKKRFQWVLRFPPVACLPPLPVKTPREEAGYEFILRWDEVINARHLLSWASCQTRSSNTKRYAAPVGELQTSVRHMMQRLVLMNCLFFTEICSLFSIASHFLQNRNSRRRDSSRTVTEGSRDVDLVQLWLTFLRWQL